LYREKIPPFCFHESKKVEFLIDIKLENKKVFPFEKVDKQKGIGIDGDLLVLAVSFLDRSFYSGKATDTQLEDELVWEETMLSLN